MREQGGGSTILRGEAAKPVPDRTDWARLRDLSEDEIERIAAEDEDNPATSEDDWADAFVGLPPTGAPQDKKAG